MAESYGSLGEIEEKGLGSSLSSLLARLDQGPSVVLYSFILIYIPGQNYLYHNIKF